MSNSQGGQRGLISAYRLNCRIVVFYLPLPLSASQPLCSLKPSSDALTAAGPPQGNHGRRRAIFWHQHRVGHASCRKWARLAYATHHCVRFCGPNCREKRGLISATMQVLFRADPNCRGPISGRRKRIVELSGKIISTGIDTCTQTFFFCDVG